MALWTAVMNGDAATLRQYGEAGRLSPALRDSNGHSSAASLCKTAFRIVTW